MAEEPWAPKTRDELVGVFKDSILGAMAEDREAEAKAKQAAGKDADTDKDKDKEPKSTGFANWLLGNR